MRDNMEKAILVAVNLGKSENEFNDELLELENLCEACEIEVIDKLIQNRTSFNPATYVGKGKIEEIKVAIDSLDLEIVIINDELTPKQIINLEKELDIAIYDRTYIILEIFHRRANTKEAILQVELASQKYMLPRLIGLHKSLSRQRGSGGGFAHGRGAGETKLELDRRKVNDQIAAIKKELDGLTSFRKQQRIKRKKNQMKVVSLVGYTNSGKSSTLNGLLKYSVSIKKEVLEKDMLFATLETSTRLIKTEHNLQFLLTDTVGFVSKLPHQLVEAFKSTLEEITESDLIIHIVDGSNPSFDKQIATTNKVLDDLGVKDIPIIYAFNKVDLKEDYLFIPSSYENAIRISATKDINLDRLLTLIEDSLYNDYQSVSLKIPYTNATIINLIKENAIVISLDSDDEFYNIKAKVSDYLYEIVKEYQIDYTT